MPRYSSTRVSRRWLSAISHQFSACTLRFRGRSHSSFVGLACVLSAFRRFELRSFVSLIIHLSFHCPVSHSPIHPSKRILLASIALLCLLPVAVQAQRISIPPTYTYSPDTTSSDAWTTRAFDDSDWMQILSTDFPRETWTGVGLFRFAVSVDSAAYGIRQGMRLQYNGSMQVYVDGVQLNPLTLQTVGPGIQQSDVYAFSFVRPPSDTLATNTHIIAFSYDSSPLGTSMWQGVSPFFFFDVGSLPRHLERRAQQVTRWKTHQMLLTGLSIAFAFLHLLLFLFQRNPRAHLYFALIAIGYAINVFFDVQNIFETRPVWVLWNERLNYLGSFVMILAGLRLLYGLFYENRPAAYLVFFWGGLLLMIGSWVQPFGLEIIGQTFALVAIAEMTRVLVQAALRKQTPRLSGGWILALGLVLFVLSFLIGYTASLLGVGWLVDVPLERYGFLLFLMTMSGFLAFNVATTSQALQHQTDALAQEVHDKEEALQALHEAMGEVKSLQERLAAENIYLQDEIRLTHNFAEIITQSPKLHQVLQQVEQVGVTDATVLITGESGTGKELLARAIHNISKRKHRPLVKVNCAALPANLIESELFGHERGAFTGALARRIGRFELADKGTIFLDEIGELPLDLQAKLLRVLQEGEFERLGLTQTLKVDVRIIAATNRNLEHEIKEGTFREDLYYRLNVFPLNSPPLRDRKEDISLLVQHFVKKFTAKSGKQIQQIPQSVLDRLHAYHWPGNVRELENIVERAVIISATDKLQLGDWLSAATPGSESGFPTLVENEQAHIRAALERTGGRVGGPNGAAALLDMKRTTLLARMKKLGIEPRG